MTAPFGPGKPNLPDDQGLVSGLLNFIYEGLPNIFAGLIPTNSVVSPQALPIFGQRDSTTVSPTKGDTKAPSMIRAMNFYAQMAVPQLQFMQPGATSVGPGAIASLASQQGSLYF